MKERSKRLCSPVLPKGFAISQPPPSAKLTAAGRALNICLVCHRTGSGYSYFGFVFCFGLVGWFFGGFCWVLFFFFLIPSFLDKSNFKAL